MTLAGAGIAKGLRDALATADLRRQQVGSAASIGGWAFMVGLSVYAYQAGGAAAVGLAALVRMLPAGFAASWERRTPPGAASTARASSSARWSAAR